MNALWDNSHALALAALQGLTAPWLIVVVLVLTTFLLEDLAIATGAALAAQGVLSWPLVFAAVAGGIALGDLGLYGLGYLARYLPWLRRRYLTPHGPWLLHKLQSRLGHAVLLARVIPGLRLVTYTVCGAVNVPVAAFIGWVMLAVTLWTSTLFWISATIGRAIANSLHLPLALAAAIPIVMLVLLTQLVRRIHPTLFQVKEKA